MAKLHGVKQHASRLKSLSGPEFARQVGAVLFNSADTLVKEAQGLIVAGSASGSSGGKHQHVPSRPGEPPNNFSGVLKDHIEALHVEPLRVEVSAKAPYAAALEFGTSKMAERPYMRPATANTRQEIVETVRKAVAKIVRGGKVVS